MERRGERELPTKHLPPTSKSGEHKEKKKRRKETWQYHRIISIFHEGPVFLLYKYEVEGKRRNNPWL